MKKNQKNEQNKDIYVNQNLLNIISPSGISFDNNYADIGEGVGKIFCISRYPSELDYGWLSDIVNLPGAAATVEYRYSPEDIMIAQFNRRISELKSAREDLNSGESIVDYTLDDSLGFSDMALHIQNLRQFFGIYFGMENFKDPGVRMAFEKALIETYRQAGISWDTDISKLKNEDFPTCSDFYDVTMDMSKEDGISSREKENFERLGEMLFSMGQGADSFLWNGITTLTSKSKYIVLDTSKLLEMDDNIRNAQFFNLCMWQWHRMSQNRSEKVLAHMDEGYLYADPDFPQLMKNIRNISKRGRKYEAGIHYYHWDVYCC